MIAEHFVGETTIAGYDVMNEVTGSPGDILQIAMYNAIRAKDPNRLLIVSRLGVVAWSNATPAPRECHTRDQFLGTWRRHYPSELSPCINPSAPLTRPDGVRLGQPELPRLDQRHVLHARVQVSVAELPSAILCIASADHGPSA